MIRRSTLAVLVVFILAVAALLLLQNSPNSPLSPASTPMSTTAPSLLSGWNSQDISTLIYKQSTGGEIRLTRGLDGNWVYANEGPAPQGTVEQLTSEIVAIRMSVQISDGQNLKDFLLDNPTQAITLQSVDGKTTTIQIGGLTPTQSGYYVMVDQNAPAVVGKESLETVLQLFDEAKPIPPTSEDGAVDPTVTPNP